MHILLSIPGIPQSIQTASVHLEKVVLGMQAVAVELDWRRRLRLALDAAKGMHYLHTRQPPVIHRDLKSANLLVDKHWQAKVADFNLSRVMLPSAAVSSLAATNPR